MELQQETKTVVNHVICPRCKKPDGTIDHLLPAAGVSSYTWYCDNENCGCKYNFSIEAGRVLSVTDLKISSHKPFVILSTNNSTLEEAVYIVVQGLLIDIPVGTEHPLTNEQMNNFEHFYRSHTCPTNFVRTELVMHDLDTDPHGVFHFVDAIMPDTLMEQYGEDADYESPEKEGWDNYLAAWARDVADFEIRTRDAVKGIYLKPKAVVEPMNDWIKEFGGNPERSRHLVRWVEALGSENNISLTGFAELEYVAISCDQETGRVNCVQHPRDVFLTDKQ